MEIIDIIFYALMGIVVSVLILFSIGLVIDFQEFSKLMDAKTPEDIQKICSDDWYSAKTVQNMPTKCLPFVIN